MPTVKQLGAAYKAQYPGSYKDVDEVELGRAYKKQYPGSYDKFTEEPVMPFETPLTDSEEADFQKWKAKYAPHDSGEDYDYRGAFKDKLSPDKTSGHWLDTYKKPNHPLFSDESKYAKDRPELAGHWGGPNRDIYIPPRGKDQLVLAGHTVDGTQFLPPGDMNAGIPKRLVPAGLGGDAPIQSAEERQQIQNAQPVQPEYERNPFAKDLHEGGAQVIEGVKKALALDEDTRKGYAPSFTRNTLGGLSDIGGGMMKAVEKPAMVAGAVAAGIPATIGGIGAGIASGHLGRKAAEYLGADPDTAGFAELLTGLVGGGAAGKWLHGKFGPKAPAVEPPVETPPSAPPPAPPVEVAPTGEIKIGGKGGVRVKEGPLKSPEVAPGPSAEEAKIKAQSEAVKQSIAKDKALKAAAKVAEAPPPEAPPAPVEPPPLPAQEPPPLPGQGEAKPIEARPPESNPELESLNLKPEDLLTPRDPAKPVTHEERRGVAKHFFDTEYNDLPEEDQALVNKLIEVGAGEGAPNVPPSIAGQPLSIGGTGVSGIIENLIQGMKKKDPKTIMNFDNIKVDDATKRMIQRQAAQSVIDTKMNPYAVESHASIAEAAKGMGIPHAQNLVAMIKKMGFENRVAPYALKQHFNRLASDLVKTETKLSDPNISEDEHADLVRKAHILEWNFSGISDTLVGHDTEMGRNLSALRQQTDNTWDTHFWINKAKRYNEGKISTETRNQILRVLDKGRDATTPEQKIKAKDELVELVGGKLKRSWLDTAVDAYKSSILSAPTVHGGNIIGNLTVGAMKEAARAVSAGADAVMGKLTGQRTITMPEFRDSLGKMLSGSKTDPLRREMLAMEASKFEKRVSYSDNKVDQFVRKWMIEPNFKLLSAEDKVFKVASWELSVSAQAKVQAVNEAKLLKRSGQPVPDDFVSKRTQELSDKPTPAMQKQAVEDADVATLNNENLLSMGYQGARRMIRTGGDKLGTPGAAKALLAAADFIQPFTKVPTNLAIMGLNHSINLPFKAGYHVTSALLKSGKNVGQHVFGKEKVPGNTFVKALVSGLEPAHQKGIADAVGKGTVGTGLAALAYHYMIEGKAIPQSAQNDPGELNRAKARHASPGAIQVGGYWHKLSPFGPAAAVFGMNLEQFKNYAKDVGPAAAQQNGVKGFLKYMQEHHLNPADPIGSVANTAVSAKNALLPTVMDMPMLKGIEDFKRMATTGKEGVYKYAANKAASMLPYSGFLSELSSLTDPSVRAVEAESPADILKHTVQTKVPGTGRSDLPPRVGPRGEPMPSAPMNPFRSVPDVSDEVTKELDKLGTSINPMPFTPKETVKHLEERAFKRGLEPKRENETDPEFMDRAGKAGFKPGELSRDEHLLYSQLEAHIGADYLKKLVNSPQYQQGPDGKPMPMVVREKLIEKVRGEVRKQVREWINGPEYQALPKEKRIEWITNLLKQRGLR